jgi:hypothetical protein
VLQETGPVGVSEIDLLNCCNLLSYPQNTKPVFITNVMGLANGFKIPGISISILVPTAMISNPKTCIYGNL